MSKNIFSYFFNVFTSNSKPNKKIQTLSRIHIA